MSEGEDAFQYGSEWDTDHGGSDSDEMSLFGEGGGLILPVDADDSAAGEPEVQPEVDDDGWSYAQSKSDDESFKPAATSDDEEESAGEAEEVDEDPQQAEDQAFANKEEQVAAPAKRRALELKRTPHRR